MGHLITKEFMENCIPSRDNNAHKYKNGFVTTVVGSSQYPGAARLSTQAAMRVGAGGVYALLPESLWPIVGSIPAEVIPLMIKEYEGALSMVEAIEKFLLAVSRSSALLVGCGIGRQLATWNVVKSMLCGSQLPCLIDGDGLSMLGHFGEEFLVNHSQGRWVLTPHQGEWHKLVQEFGETDHPDPHRLAQKWNCVILLKGFPAYIYGPEGEIYQNTTGNPAATTAGCGDVLAGMIAGYLAQGLPPVKAACVGMLHAGQVADALVTAKRCHSLMASDILLAL